MEEHETVERYFAPVDAHMMGIPEDHMLKLCYEVYKPSPDTLKLTSEAGRKIFADAFFEDYRLGPLSDLSLRALSAVLTIDQLMPSIRMDPVKMRIYYDSLSIDLPIEKCYFINDDKYWRRMVMAKGKDKSLAFETSYDWKGLALSMKFVEVVEGWPAEYWPEDEMKPLAMLIKDDVKEMHIRRLQSLQEHSFNQYFLSDSDRSSDEMDSTDISSLTPTPKTSIGSEENQSLQLEPVSEVEQQTEKTEEELMQEREEAELLSARREEELRQAQEVAEIRAARREEKRKLKELQRLRRVAREERRKRRLAKKGPPPAPEPPPTGKGKKKKQPKPKGVFDIEVEPPEDSGEDDIVDKRNLAKVLRRKKRYTYPAEDCHHINLRFVRFFENLVEFTIEFLGPELKRDYHERHLNFSYVDIENLAFGVSTLQQLKVFRLRSSRMDARKLAIMTKSLTQLPCLETVDFGCNQLQDDCGIALYQLLHLSTSIKSLELEHNNIGAQTVRQMSTALFGYAGTLEYLGLGGNPLGDQTLHALNNKILGSSHISHLSVRSASISQGAIVCCIANELLRSHPTLVKLDMSSVHMDTNTGIELLRALYNNTTIQVLNYNGCDVDPVLEFELELLIKRNRYIFKNPYIGDPTKTQEEIDEYVQRIKNPTLLRAMEAVEKRAECYKNRPLEYVPSEVLPEVAALAAKQSAISARLQSMVHLETLHHTVTLPNPSEPEALFEAQYFTLPNTPFFYDPNNFTEEEFFTHVYLPGPAERYCYFRQRIKPAFFGKCLQQAEAK